MNRKRTVQWSLIAVFLCFALIPAQNVFASCYDDICLESEHGSQSVPTAEAARATEVTFNDLALVQAPTQNEKAKKEEARMGVPRVLAGYFRYENVEIGTLDGDIYGGTLGLAWDMDNVSYGFVVPYDNMDFEGTDADRYGIVGFFQYNAAMLTDWMLGLTANANWFYTDYEATNVTALGAGVSVSFSYDSGGVFVPSLAFSYQYNQDDTDVLYNFQHLFKSGLNLGFRVGDAASINLYGIWNEDISDHMKDVDENDSADVGIEARYNISDTFTLSGGYKAVVDVTDFDSNTFYFGVLFTF